MYNNEVALDLSKMALTDPGLAGELIARVFLPLDKMDDDVARAGCILMGQAIAALVSLVNNDHTGTVLSNCVFNGTQTERDIEEIMIRVMSRHLGMDDLEVS